MRRSFAATTVAPLLVLVAFTGAFGRTSRAEPTRPKVVVALVVDQLGAWIADERWPLLPDTGGFARLRREGTWAHAVVYPHAVTDTAPGHAALFTGGGARESGIFGNEVIDDATRLRVSILRDEQSHVIASDGPRELPSSSLRALKLPTLADALRAEKPTATIVALSLKDRAALFGGGRKPTATLWFDAGLGRWVTSSALADAFPAWALPAGGPDFLRSQLGRVWEPLDATFVAAHAATPDAQSGESDLDGLGASFPHVLARVADPARAFRGLPFADDALLALALAAVDARDATQPMLLAVSLSANDYVGHLFGPDSWEAWDELERLDAALGRFFAALDERVGADGWAALLSADHGVTTLPEAASLARPWCAGAAPDRFQRSCAPPGRVLPDKLTEELRSVAEHALGPGDWIAGVADPYVYLAPAGRALPAARRRTLDAALTAALRARAGVAGVWDAQHPPARCRAGGDTIDDRVCRALVPGAPGELYVALQPGWFFDADYVPGSGSSHGSPYLYDRAVPLLVRAPGRVPARATLDSPIGPAVYAHTAASLLDIAPPPGARNGRDLTKR